MRSGSFLGSVPMTEKSAANNVIDERAFARATDTRNAGKGSDWDPRVYILEIIFGRAQHFEPAPLDCGFNAAFRDLNIQFPPQIFSSQRSGRIENVLKSPGS